jgi:uncharacterized protein YbaP (TraB family)
VGRFKRGFCGWLLFLGLLGGVSAHAEAPVWALKGAKNTVYLAGSVHLLPQSDSKLPAAFDKAYADSAALVMEIDMDDLNPMDAQGLMMSSGLLTGDQTLSGLIGKARFEKLQKQVSSIGIPLPDEALEKFQPWVAALTVEQLQLMKLGFDQNSGVEMQLTHHAKGDRKEITGFETLQDQLGMLANLSTADQIKFLDVTLDEMQTIQGELAELLAAWRAGNTTKLASILSEEYGDAPRLYATLVSDRNKRWMPEIEKLLKADKNYMIVVGTLHIVGRNGLLDLLKAEGVSAKQLQ